MKIKKTNRFGLSLAAALLTLASAVLANDSQYQQVNLVSDVAGQALTQDTNLVNSWGISFSAASAFWISDNGTGRATLYAVTNDAAGSVHAVRQTLVVTIPGQGNISGQAFNNVGGFNADIFLFVSEDGTISGWRPALGTVAETLVPGNANKEYKAMTLITTSNGPVMLASNFRAGTVDVYGTNANLIGQFSDADAPAGYAPFGIKAIDGIVFVTFAKQDAEKDDDLAGRGHGLIDVFDPNTKVFNRFVTGTDAVIKHAHHHGPGTPEDKRKEYGIPDLNSPWGIALAPDSFGKAGGKLLVGNFGSGTIMTFDADGKFLGELKGKHGTIKIEGLWSLTFGNGAQAGLTDTLYFTSGPGDESHGLFGSLSLIPKRSGHGHVTFNSDEQDDNGDGDGEN